MFFVVNHAALAIFFCVARAAFFVSQGLIFVFLSAACVAFVFLMQLAQLFKQKFHAFLLAIFMQLLALVFDSVWLLAALVLFATDFGSGRDAAF